MKSIPNRLAALFTLLSVLCFPLHESEATTGHWKCPAGSKLNVEASPDSLTQWCVQKATGLKHGPWTKHQDTGEILKWRYYVRGSLLDSLAVRCPPRSELQYSFGAKVSQSCVRIEENGYQYRTGRSLTWSSRGRLTADEQYLNGERQGASRFWYKNGSPQREGSWRDGTPVGIHLHFGPDGRIASRVEYVDGVGRARSAPVVRVAKSPAKKRTHNYGSDLRDFMELNKHARKRAEGGPEVFAELVKELSHQNINVRRVAASAMAFRDDFGERSDESVPTLLRMLSDQDDILRERTRLLLCSSTPNYVLEEHLLPAVAQAKGEELIALTHLYSCLNPPSQDAVRSLSALLQHDQRRVRGKAAQALGELGEPAVSEIRKLLESKDIRLQFAGVAALKSLSTETPGIIELMRVALSSEELAVRSRAAVAAGGLSKKGVALVPEIAELLSNPRTRRIATATLLRFGPPALPKLKEFIERTENSEHRDALEAVEKEIEAPLKTVRAGPGSI